MKISWKCHLIAIIFKKSHDMYRVCHGRNMPTFYSYEKLTQILSVNILEKRGQGPCFTKVLTNNICVGIT